MIPSYVCVDLETTGLNPKQDKIIEIGAVRMENGVETGTFSELVNPGRLLEPRITELTGIRDEDLADAPIMEEVLPELLSFMGEMPLLGHSVLFDFSFLKKAAVNQRLSFERQGVDTLKIARKYLSTLESRSLGALCMYYGIPHHAHRALEDAEATCILYTKLSQAFETDDTKADFEPGKLIYQVKRESPITKPQKERLYKLIERHKLEVNVQIDRLTRNEASRYTDQILARYGR